MHKTTFSHKYQVGDQVFVVDNSFKPKNNPFTIEKIFVVCYDNDIRVEYLVVDKYSSRRLREDDIFDNELDCDVAKEFMEKAVLNSKLVRAKICLKEAEIRKLQCERQVEEFSKQLSQKPLDNQG